jgi:hypothetical protein
MKFSGFVAKYRPEVMLENYQRRTLEWLDKLDFAEIEKRILSSQIREPGESLFDQLVLAVDFATPGYGDLTSVCIGRKIWMDKGEIRMMIIDDIYTEPQRDPSWHALDKFFNEPVVQEEPEPRAKNGALASKKTERAKAKLAFYQGKRRF